MRNFVLVLMIVVSAACTKNYHTVISGGQDSGGGDPTGSRIEVVKAHLVDMVAIMSEVDHVINFFKITKEREGSYENQVFYKFYDLLIDKKIGRETDLSDDFITVRHRMIMRKGGRAYRYSPSSLPPVSIFDVATNEIDFSNNYDFILDLQHQETLQDPDGHSFSNDRMKKSYTSYPIEFDIRESQPCRDLHNNPKAGAVEALDGSIIKICLSMKELQKIPQGSLRSQIIALIIHEMSHLVGFSEPEAVNLQEQVVRYYELETHKVAKPLTLFSLKTSLMSSAEVLGKYISMHNRDAFIDVLNNCMRPTKEGPLAEMLKVGSLEGRINENKMFVEQYKEHLMQQSMIYSDEHKNTMQALILYERVLDEYGSIILAQSAILGDYKLCPLVKIEDIDFMYLRLEKLRGRLDDQIKILGLTDFFTRDVYQF